MRYGDRLALVVVANLALWWLLLKLWRIYH